MKKIAIIGGRNIHQKLGLPHKGDTDIAIVFPVIAGFQIRIFNFHIIFVKVILSFEDQLRIHLEKHSKNFPELQGVSRQKQKLSEKLSQIHPALNFEKVSAGQGLGLKNSLRNF